MSFWQIIWKLHNTHWLKTKSVNSRQGQEMLHFFNTLYSDSVQEQIRLIQSNREQLNSDRQSFRGDGAYETETWTLCKATNAEWILWKMTKLNSLIQSITWTVQDQTIKVEVKVEVLIQRDTKYLVCLWEAGLYSGKHFKNLPNILWFSLNFHNKS